MKVDYLVDSAQWSSLLLLARSHILSCGWFRPSRRCWDEGKDSLRSDWNPGWKTHVWRISSCRSVCLLQPLYQKDGRGLVYRVKAGCNRRWRGLLAAYQGIAGSSSSVTDLDLVCGVWSLQLSHLECRTCARHWLKHSCEFWCRCRLAWCLHCHGILLDPCRSPGRGSQKTDSWDLSFTSCQLFLSLLIDASWTCLICWLL